MSSKPKVICITGGKGGTGKTLCAVNIAIMFKNSGKKVLLIDGDVENPNTYLLLNGTLENRKSVPFFKPKIIEENCTKCGTCSDNCNSHALLKIVDSYPIPILAVCNGCRLCYKICPSNAIEADFKEIGCIYSTQAHGLDLSIGELKPSEARSAAIVDVLLEDLQEILEKEPTKYDVVVMDTAPGAHCDVELLLGMADLVIPVTEPTKFGKLDLLRIIELIELLGKSYKVIVNRSSLLGFKKEFLKELEERDIKVLGDIPLDNDIVKSYCQGIPLMEESGGFDQSGKGYESFQTIFDELLKWMEED